MSGVGIDIKLLRSNPDIFRESQRKRNKSVELIDEILAADGRWVEGRRNLDRANREYNAASKAIGQKKRKGEPCDDLMAQQREKAGEIERMEKELVELEIARDQLCNKVGALVSERACVSDSEDNNATLREHVGSATPEPGPNGLLSHVDLMPRLGMVEYSQAVKIAGERAYFLKGPGYLLSLALQTCAMDFMVRKGYLPVQTPYFMNQGMMARCAQLEQFDEELYKISAVSRGGESQGEEEKYLIATSEQPISAMHHDTRFAPETLPLKYVGFSTNFRKEVGSHGRDTTGIFRIHQFDKVEQFAVADPAHSYEMFDEMVGNAEEFYQMLGLSYRIVNIASGALNNAAAVKYDLEANFPGSKAFRELCSCSNCLDYQSRKLDSRYGLSTSRDPKVPTHVHMLNATLTAIQRTLCCIVETYQTPRGIRVPEPLRRFMVGNPEFIEFIDLPKETPATEAPATTTDRKSVV